MASADSFHGGLQARLRAHVVTGRDQKLTVQACIERQGSCSPGEIDAEDFFLRHFKVRMSQWQEAETITEKPGGWRRPGGSEFDRSAIRSMPRL